MPHALTAQIVLPQLELLDRGRQIAFGIFMLERAMPLLMQFQKEVGWTGGGGLVRAALAQVWAALEADDDRYLRFLTEDHCDRALPDSEDFGPYVSAAIDTVDMACNLLAFLESGDTAGLVECVERRQDTVWMMLPDEFIGSEVSHPFVTEEVAFLESDLSALQSAPVKRSELVTWVLERIDTQGYRALRLP
ncbi:YjaG family protein [Luteibacter aegosomaticola]|uniref:DUF416 family protein n=1 Tax=Luteibacter aegosomaticola TaxID=2911538 RepID=UPI001FFA99F5|nr:DUF416 family protein [Luteibacter aegosomaticola]UPG90496.1 YjaG family protein [Luteibacter aegosomaticola]